MSTIRRLLSAVVAPALPTAPRDYGALAFNHFNSVLRLYFNRIDAAFSALLDINGGALISNPYGEFYTNAQQTLTGANTITNVTIGATQVASGMSLASNKITFSTDGTYNILYVLQTTNSSASIQDSTVWLRENGVDIPNSAYLFSVSPQHGGVDGRVAQSADFVFQAAAGDFVEIMWAATSTSVSLYYEPAQVIPYAHPSVPSAHVIVTFISAI